MDKSHAIELLGGSISSAAAALKVSYQAVKQWPETLSPRIADRVLAALARQKFGADFAEVRTTNQPKEAAHG